MRFASASSDLSNIRSSARRIFSGSISPYGIISFAFTMAQSSPTFTAWYKNTEFITILACFSSPKLILLNPKTVYDSGMLSCTMRIPSRVFFPASRNSFSPVANVNVKTSKMNWCFSSLYFLPSCIIMRATCSFSSGVFAMPSGPIHIAMAGAPYFAMSGAICLKRKPSPSRFIEFIMGSPGICSSDASITFGSVESITRGASTVRQRCFTRLHMNSFSLSLSVVATHTSRQ